MSDLACLFCHEHLSALAQCLMWLRDALFWTGLRLSRSVR